MSVFADTTPDRFLTSFYTSFQEEVIFGEEDPGTVIDRYFSPGFVQVNDGVALDRERLAAHVRPVKKMMASGSYEVCEAVADGNRLAARMIVHAVTKKGQEISTEVYLFGDVDDQGRFSRIDQITRALSKG